jgi:hypothetical protein
MPRSSWARRRSSPARASLTPRSSAIPRCPLRHPRLRSADGVGAAGCRVARHRSDRGLMRGRVVWVVDGDTIHVRIAHREGPLHRRQRARDPARGARLEGGRRAGEPVQRQARRWPGCAPRTRHVIRRLLAYVWLRRSKKSVMANAGPQPRAARARFLGFRADARARLVGRGALSACRMASGSSSPGTGGTSCTRAKTRSNNLASPRRPRCSR